MPSPVIVTILRRRRAATLAAPTPPARRIDPRGLVHRVAVLLDRKAVGSGDTWGDAGPDFGDVPVPGLEDVACRVCQLSPREVEAAGKERDEAHFTVLFGAPIELDGSNRLDWRDPHSGRLWKIVVDGPARDEGGVGHHWSADGHASLQD